MRSSQPKILISYGSKPFANTLQRLKKQAKSLHLFDKVIAYTERDLPKSLLCSPLFTMSNNRGGFWVWKAWLIWHTMQRYPRALVVYVDAGCTLHNEADEWQKWFDLMQDKDLLVTHYREGVDYGWAHAFNDERASSIAIETWTKPEAVAYFDARFGNKDWHKQAKCWAGFLMVKNKMPLIKDWLDTMLQHSNLLTDCEVGGGMVKQAYSCNIGTTNPF